MKLYSVYFFNYLKYLLLVLPICLFISNPVLSEEQYKYPDIFALESDNQWTYKKKINGIISEISERVSVDSITFDSPTFFIEQTSSLGESTTNTWYQRTLAERILIGFETNGTVNLSYYFTNNTGLIEAWATIEVDQTKSSQATGTASWLPFNINLDVTVVAIESVTIPIGTFQAYHLKYVQTLNVLGLIESDEYSVWMLPFLPVLKYDYPEKGYTVELSSFKIKGGAIDMYTDTDNDSLKDFEELSIYHTHPNKRDTDNDGIDDHIEIQNNTDPLQSNAIMSDINKNGKIDMQDVIMIFQALTTN